MDQVNGFSNYATDECYRNFFADVTLENVYDDPDKEFDIFCEGRSRENAERAIVLDIATRLEDTVIETFKFNVDYQLSKEVYGWALLGIRNVVFEEIAQLLFDEWEF